MLRPLEAAGLRLRESCRNVPTTAARRMFEKVSPGVLMHTDATRDVSVAQSPWTYKKEKIADDSTIQWRLKWINEEEGNQVHLI